MSSDLTRCNCCGGGCSSSCGNCNGDFFPDTVQVTFTPHWLGAWTANLIKTEGELCYFSGQTVPDCEDVLETLGDYPQWHTGSPVTLTLPTAQGGTLYSCLHEYSNAVSYPSTDPVEIATPSGLPAWSANPMGLSSSSDDWCVIETGRDIFGAGKKWSHWAAELSLRGVRCDSAGSGTDTNTIIASLRIMEGQQDPAGFWTWGTVFGKRLMITSSNSDCSCFRTKFGTGAWVARCQDNDCWDGPGWGGPSNNGYKVDWANYALGSENVTWSSSIWDCCTDESVDIYYTGGSDPSTSDCYELPKDWICGSGGGGGSINLPTFSLSNTPASNNTLHYGSDWNPEVDYPCYSEACIVERYGYSLSDDIRAVTDLSIEI